MLEPREEEGYVELYQGGQASTASDMECAYDEDAPCAEMLSRG